MALQFRRGTAADVTSETFVPEVGEPVYLTDQEKLYIGDGTTVGGNLVGGAETLTDLTDLHLTTQDVETISSFSISGNTVNLNTVDANNYKVNQQISITNSPATVLNGTHTIVGTPTANTILFQLTAVDTASTTTSGTITPIIQSNAVLAYNTTNARFEDTATSQIIGVLKNHSDIVPYDSQTAAPSNTDTGKVLRYDYTNQWTPKRAGESIDYAAGGQYIGIDWSNGPVGSIYTGNATRWTEDSTAANSLTTTSGSYVPRTPYANGVEDDDTITITNVDTFVNSSDFTLDFWLLRDTGANWDDGMLFRDSVGNTAFSVEYNSSFVDLKCNITATNVNTGILMHDVVRWSIGSTDNEWIHLCIAREGTSFRLWKDGVDQGAGTLQGSYASDFDFQFSRFTNFRPIQSESDFNQIGPLFVDLKKAWRDPAGGDITVPVKPLDFYNYKSGVNITELNDVSEFESFVDGDTLTYWKDGFQKGKPFYSKYKFNINSAPTGVIANSERIGTGNGFWRPLTMEHFTTNGQGPRTTDREPTFEADETLGQFLVPEDGIYHIIATVTICRNNLSADTYYTNEVVLDTSQSMLTTNERSCHLSFATNSSAPTSIIRQTATIHTIERIKGDTIGISVRFNNVQSDEFYAEEAFLTFHKVG